MTTCALLVVSNSFNSVILLNRMTPGGTSVSHARKFSRSFLEAVFVVGTAYKYNQVAQTLRSHGTSLSASAVGGRSLDSDCDLAQLLSAWA